MPEQPRPPHPVTWIAAHDLISYDSETLTLSIGIGKGPVGDAVYLLFDHWEEDDEGERRYLTLDRVDVATGKSHQLYESGWIPPARADAIDASLTADPERSPEEDATDA